MKTLITKLARLDEAEPLREPEAALNLEASDVRQLLFETAPHHSGPASPAAGRCLWVCRTATLGFNE